MDADANEGKLGKEGQFCLQNAWKRSYNSL